MSSPAAAAGVARILMNAGVKRAIEIARGMELEGFYASPKGDHVQVEWVPSPFADEAQHPSLVEEGLKRCESALEGKYQVTRGTATLTRPGEVYEGAVLEVRSERWGR